MIYTQRRVLTKPSLLNMLAELKDKSNIRGSLYLPPNSIKATSRSSIPEIAENGTNTIPEELPRLLFASPTGGVVFWEQNVWYLVLPPFPLEAKSVFDYCEIEPMYSILNKNFLISLILIRYGEYGIGVFQGDKILTSKVGTGLVHSRHRKGGSSAHRFERHRDKQIETFFTRVCENTKEQLEPYIDQLEYILYGGARETVLDFRKQCPFLGKFDDRTLTRLLNIRQPRQRGMIQGIIEAWSSRVIQWNII